MGGGFFDIMGMGSKADSQQQKDFRKLESTIVKTCTFHCLRRERAYEAESEMCMAKCFDLAYIYTRIGLAEINAFAYENRIVK